MGPLFSLSVFFLIWWVVLFMVLPWGVVSYHEAGIDPKDGGDPGAPVDPNLKKKFLLTTVISLGIFAIIWLMAFFHLFPLSTVAKV